MRTFRRAGRAASASVCAAILGIVAVSRPASAEGLFEAISGDITSFYSVLSTRTTSPEGGTVKTETSTWGSRFNLRVNHDLLPKLYLEAFFTYDKLFSDLSGDVAGSETEQTRFRPSIWLRRRDPILTASVGYDRFEDTVDTEGVAALTLTRDLYSLNVDWRPTELPSTELRYYHSDTYDDPRTSVDVTQDYLYLKEEYVYGGLRTSYTGTYIRTENHMRDREDSQLSHELKLLYSTTFLDGRVALTTDNRVVVRTLEGEAEAPLPPLVGISAFDDTPVDGPLDSNPALIDGDRTTSAGLNLGFPGPGGDFTARNVGLDFVIEGGVNRLHVWVDGWGPGSLPPDITSAFTWDIYTSRDNLIWTFHATVTGVFGPFDRRFELRFPGVTTRYVKAVTRPLLGGVVGSTNSSLYPNIFVTEVEAFTSRENQDTSRTTQTLENFTLDVKVILLRSPFLYYRFYGDYLRFDPGGDFDSDTHYTLSNGLFLTHRFNPVLSTSANATVEIGSDADRDRTTLRYYASLAATPLPTLTDTLVFSGYLEWQEDTTSTNNALVLYNTAQLYRGLDVTLNLGAVITTQDEDLEARGAAPPPGTVPTGPVGPPRPRPPNPGALLELAPRSAVVRSQEPIEEDGGGTIVRKDVYLNVGTTIAPHPNLTLTSYYLGKLSQVSGGRGGRDRDSTEHRLDLGLSFTPFRTLFLSALVTVDAETDRDTRVQQSYAISWAPFPDGRLQLSLSYLEDYLPEHSRIVQPTIRWYLSGARRSYLEATYQYNTTEAGRLETESHLFVAGFRIFF